jgi:hypothetical protein
MSNNPGIVITITSYKFVTFILREVCVIMTVIITFVAHLLELRPPYYIFESTFFVKKGF